MGGTRPFARIPIRERPEKPRQRGITAVMDWGMPIPLQEGLLELAGDAVDLAKIAMGLAALFTHDVLDQKLELYHRHGVKVHPGKMLLEYAANRGLETEFFRECRAVGFDLVEIADDVHRRTVDTKSAFMRAADAAGVPFLAVVDGRAMAAKAGRADPSIDDLVADVRRCRAAGAWKLVIGSWEVMSGDSLRQDVLGALRAELATEDIIWEVPGLVTNGRLTASIRDLELFLVTQFGKDVNVANMSWDWIVPFEGLRRGIGLNSRDPVAGDSR